MNYRFGEIEVDRELRSIRRGGERVSVPARAFDILLYLIENRERVVPRSELLDAVWHDVVVEDGNLTQNVSVLRRSIGDDSTDEPLILTVPGLGYRFTGALLESGAGEERTISRGATGRWVAIVVLAVLAGVATTIGLLAGRGGDETISIAVLPVRAGGFDRPADEEGLIRTAAIIAELARDRHISVRPSSEVNEFVDPRDDTATEAGAQLGVSFVLEGYSVGPDDESALQLQLIDVARRQVIWSGQWNGGEDLAAKLLRATVQRRR